MPSDRALGNHHYLRLGMIVPIYMLYKLFGMSVITYYGLPLFMCLLGVALSYVIVRRYCGKIAAWVAALFQIFNPLEIDHATNLLSDMPAATLTVAYFGILLFASSKQMDVKFKVFAGVFAGINILWIYFLRSNAPVFLGPIILIGLINKRTRAIVLVSIAILIAGVLAELVKYKLNGAELGYRFNVTSIAVERYKPFLPIYHDFTDYLFRYPDAVARKSNITVLAMFYISILAHLIIIVLHKDYFLKALALSGILSLVIFWFMVFGPISAGYVTQPPSMRYVQLFLSTSIICVPVMLLYMIGIMASKWRSITGSKPFMHKFALMCAFYLAIAAIVMSFCHASLTSKQGLWSSSSKYYSVLKAIHTYMDEADLKAINVMGTTLSIRGIKIYTWLPADKSVTWQAAEVAEMRSEALGNPDQLFVTDLIKEKSILRYVRGEDQLKRRSQRYADIENIEKNDTEMVARTARLVLSRGGNITKSRHHVINSNIIRNNNFESWHGNHPADWGYKKQGDPDIFQRYVTDEYGSSVVLGNMYIYQTSTIDFSMEDCIIKYAVDAKAGESETCVVFLRLDSAQDWIQSSTNFHPGDDEWHRLTGRLYIPKDFAPRKITVMLSNRNSPTKQCIFDNYEMSVYALKK